MTTIKISRLFGTVCVDSDEGAALGRRIRDGLSTDDSVMLDFEGVGTLTSSFLNAAIGCLYSSFSADELKRRLLWRGLDETDEGILQLVMKKATLFYAADIGQRDVMTSVSAHATDH
jgi:STAS-like domain of unknown function (DUF4325)